MARKQTNEVETNNQTSSGVGDKVVMAFELRFTAPLIMHAFDQKAVEEILGGQTGRPQELLPKVPSECVERATLRNAKGEPCILPAAFKKAVLSGASGLEKVKGLRLRSQFWVMGQSVPIDFESKTDRMDMVKVGPWNQRTVDVRFRPQFDGVRCTIVVKVPAKMTQEMVVELINRAGEVGIGEWRPEKAGGFGTFEVDGVVTTVAGVKEALARCAPVVPPLVIPEWARDIKVSPTVLARIMSDDKPGDEAEVD